ncbi:MAG: ATP-binding protein [Treponema sp.]|nr:ATP-binding protein [Treponema sp.]
MLKQILKMLFITGFIIAGFSACEQQPLVNQYDINPFASFRNIPGITEQEISDIEKLQREYESFTYAMVQSTDAFVKESGEIGGYAALFSEWLTGLFEIPFKIEFHPLSVLYEKLDAQELDFAGVVMLTDENRQRYHMTDVIAERMFVLFRIAGSRSLSRIAAERLPRYAFLENAPAERLFAAHNEPGSYETVWVRTAMEGYQVIKSGEADAFFTSNNNDALYIQYGDVVTEDFFPLTFNPVAMATANPAFESIISVVTKAQRNGASIYHNELYKRGYQEYQKHKLSVWLTDEEREYIRNNPVIPIAAVSSNYPITFYNAREKEWQGIFFDLLKEIETLTDLSFELITDEYTDFFVLLDMLKNKEVSLIGELLWTKAREEHFIWTKTVIQNDYYALISMDDHFDIAINEIRGLKVGLARNTGYTAMFRQWFPDHENTVEFDSIEETFIALRNGEVDLVMTTERRLMFLTHYQELTGYKLNYVFDQNIDTRLGFHKDDIVLCSIIDKALQSIDTKAISNRWMHKTFDYRAKIAEARVPLLIGISISFALIVILVLFLFFISRRAAKVEQERLMLMLNTCPMGIGIWGKDLNVIDCNDSNIAILGLKDKQDYKNRFYKDCFPEYQPNGLRSSEKAASLLRDAFETGYSFFEWTLKKPDDNSLIPTEVTLVRAKFGENDVVIGYTKDMREQKEQLALIEKMRDADERMRTLLEINPQINFLFDSNFRIIDCNPAAMAFMGFKTKEEMTTGFVERLTKAVPEFQPDGNKSIPLLERLNKTIKEGHVKFETELNMFGEKRVLDVEFKKIPHESSFAVVGFVHELTEMKNLVREAEKQRLEAENANKTKSVFLSHVSHEIRTPMNAILGTAEIQLQKEETTPEIEEAFSMIYSSGNLLLNIINDILDLSKIEAGKLEIIYEKYDIPSIIYDTVQLIFLRYDSKPIEFILKIDENTPLDLIGDELRIKQVLNNILSNAFKYTDKGTVELSVSAESFVDPTDSKAQTYNAGNFAVKCVLVLSVTDTGQGMTEEQVNRLFDEYTRFNIDTNRTIVGTGLGMHITKRLLDAMNGEISVKSEKGKGSVFTVRLPQERIGNNICGPELAEQLRSNRFKGVLKSNRSQIIREYMPYGSVLVVDDVESNLYVARGMMQPYGLTIETVSSGFDAIDKIKEGNKYDIIFMDHMMPVMNGIDSTKKIRDMGYTNPVVALTANALAGTSAIFLENGFDGFMSKPIDIRELNSILNRLIRDKQPPEVVEAARKQMKNQKPVSGSVNGPQNKNDFSLIVVQDIKKALAVLEDILPKINNGGGADINLFTTTVHGMKSALLNIEEAELSAVALKLERAGVAGEITEISERTPEFINALRILLEKHKPRETRNTDDISDEDKIFLTEKLSEIKIACASMQKKAAKIALDELKSKMWPRAVNEFLDDISTYLLYGEIKKIVTVVEGFMKRQSD